MSEARSIVARITASFRSAFTVVRLTWSAEPRLSLVLLFTAVAAGVLPAVSAFIGKQLVDAVVEVVGAAGDPEVEARARAEALEWLLLEGLAVISLLAASRGGDIARTLLGLRLGDHVRGLIIERALELELEELEDPELHDGIERARKQAGNRPVMFLQRCFGLLRDVLVLISSAILLMDISPLALAVVLLAGLPAFVAELRTAKERYELQRRRTLARREQGYLENVLTREDYVKEVRLFDLGAPLFDRFSKLASSVYAEERRVTTRGGILALLFGVLATVVFYGAYFWVVLRAIGGHLTIGQMTMALVVFRQTQGAVTALLSDLSGLAQDRLYLADLLGFIARPMRERLHKETEGPAPGDGIRFEHVCFTYPGATEPALTEISFHVQPGRALGLVGENGSGKSTVLKLLTGLYRPERGRVLLDGMEIDRWDDAVLRRRLGIAFQDYSRFKLTVGDNVDLGDVEQGDPAQRDAAVRKSTADAFIDRLPEGYDTRLGKSFPGGRDLSGGQWQKLALARAFMRRDADILVLDEPTASIDPEAESALYETLRAEKQGRMTLLVAHRLSVLRGADEILVLEQGRVIERGNHGTLTSGGGRYARLFELQALGYEGAGDGENGTADGSGGVHWKPRGGRLAEAG